MNSESFCKDCIFLQKVTYIDYFESLEYEYLIEFENNQDRELELVSDLDFDILSDEQNFIFKVYDVVSFHWKLHDRKISYKLYENGTEKLVKYWLAHLVFPIYLILTKNYFIMHAGVVSLDGVPLVFMADSYGGKSTMVDYFLKKGHNLVTDDKLAVYKKESDFICIPSFAYHRPYRELETLGQPTEQFDVEEKKMEFIYLLRPVDAAASVSIEEVKGIEKFKQLKHATEINFDFMFLNNAKYLIAMSKSVKVFYLHVPWDLDRLSEVYESIKKHQKELKSELPTTV